MLPTFSRLITIPDQSGVSVQATVEQEDEYDGYRLIPVQTDEGAAFSFDPAAYERDTFENEPVVRVGSPALLRNLRVVTLTVAPVRFNPVQGKIRVARRLRVQVSFSGQNPENSRRPDDRPIPPPLIGSIGSSWSTMEGTEEAATWPRHMAGHLRG